MGGFSHWLSTKCRQTSGKARRYAFTRFHKDYVADQARMRAGDCNQCGKCCEILFRCPFLTRLDEETSICSVYENRPRQCGSFPIDERCLAEVDFNCTYSFAKLPQEKTEATMPLQIDAARSSD